MELQRLAAGLAALCVLLGTAANVSDDATVGVLHDSTRGRLLAEALARTASDVRMTSDDADCAGQLAVLKTAGVRRFVSLCDGPAPPAEDVTMTTPGACRPGRPECVSLQLPAASQWPALAAVMRHLGLRRTLLADGVRDDGISEAMTEQGIVTGPLPESTLPPAAVDVDAMVVLANVSALLPALLSRAAGRPRHWFVSHADGAPLRRPALRALLGSAALYTVQAGVAATARLPQPPAGSGFSQLALAIDALAVARGAAPAEGLTGPLAVEAGRRTTSLAEVLVFRPQEAPLSAAALPVRAGDWLPVAVVRNGTLLPPSVHYVLPSRLVAQLATPAACDDGRVVVAGTDAVEGRRFRREFDARAPPRLLLVYGRRPFRVALECAGVAAEFRCRADEHSASCRRRVRWPARNGTAAPSRHARDTSTSFYTHDGHHGWRLDRRAVNRAGRAAGGAALRAGSRPVHHFAGYAAVNRASGYAPTGHGADAVAVAQNRVGVDNQAQGYDQSPAPPEYQPPPVAPRRARRPLRRDGSYRSPAPLRPRYPPSRDSSYTSYISDGYERIAGGGLVLPILPDVFGCFGSVGGCGVCVAYFSSSTATPFDTCAPACVLTIFTACTVVLGDVVKELAA